MREPVAQADLEHLPGARANRLRGEQRTRASRSDSVRHHSRSIFFQRAADHAVDVLLAARRRSSNSRRPSSPRSRHGRRPGSAQSGSARARRCRCPARSARHISCRSSTGSGRCAAGRASGSRPASIAGSARPARRRRIRCARNRRRPRRRPPGACAHCRPGIS